MRFGTLINTSDLMAKMCDPKCTDNVDDHFIKEKLGIGSIAITHSSLALCNRIWTEKAAMREAYQLANSEPNIEIYDMLELAISNAIYRAKVNPKEIKFHIHISGMMHPNGMFLIRNVLKKIGLNSEVNSIVLPQGCAGILSAIKIAQLMLGTEDGCGEVLVTAESDMLLHSHQRGAGRKSTENIDSWLWASIFGEGVGAMILGYADRKKGSKPAWQIENFHEGIAELDWRVTATWDDAKMISEMMIKARAVKKTYLKSIIEHAKEIIDDCGGIEELGNLCLHESNPNIVRLVSDSLGVPREKVPVISDKVGSLACVSAFSLIESAMSSAANNPDALNKKIGIAVIGEAGGVVRSGAFTIRDIANTQLQRLK